METDLWKSIKKPIIGQAPMDGISDAAFRYITDKYGHPSVLFTEFVSVEGINRGITPLLSAFIHHKTKTPTIAQLFGSNPKDFYNCAMIVAELGYDGLDINMGCPDRSVTKKGAGAALILEPIRAKEIVKWAKKGLRDWSEGRKIANLKISAKITDFISFIQKKYRLSIKRRLLPVSIKTRIGYDKVVTLPWINHLVEAQPAVITLHGRTLQQLYHGKADWEEIGRAATLTRGASIILLGNGDIKNIDDAKAKISKYKLGGVLIGRSSCGNPWVFQDKTPSCRQRLEVAVEHCQVFTKMLPDGHFLSLRKHLSWYCKYLKGAAKYRARLMRVKNMVEVNVIISEMLNHC